MTANNDRPDRRFSQQDCPAVHLVVPIKPLHLAKSRLLGEGARRPEAHAELVMAVALDTVAAARRADGVAVLGHVGGQLQLLDVDLVADLIRDEI
ncbi:hypothetical protein ABT308_27110, partial [Saccharopolyspora kobensis]